MVQTASSVLASGTRGCCILAMASPLRHIWGSWKAAVALLLAMSVLRPRATAAPVHRILSGEELYQCQASSEANASLYDPPPGMIVGIEHYGYYVFSNNLTGPSASIPGGDQPAKRGIFFLPLENVAPEAYGPYAIASASTGRYSVILNRAEVNLVTEVIFGRLDILEWAVVAHGERAGALAAKLVASLPGQFTALGLFASSLPDDVDLTNSNAGVYLYYASEDTVVPPSSLAKFASRLPGDAYLAPLLNAAHLGFAFSDCLGNTANQTRGGSKEAAAAPLAALRAFEQSLVARFQLWPAVTARALSFADQTLLLPNNVGSKTYPSGIPRNQVTFKRYPIPVLTPAPPKSWYVFAPENIENGVGLVYFPGAGVPIQGYFPIAFEIAARGILVVLLEQPSRFTSLDDDVCQLASDANTVIDSTIFEDLGVKKWAVGGHSRGGGAATEIVWLQNESRNTRKVQAIVLHAGRVAVNLTSSPLPVVLIHGSIDRFYAGQPLSPFLNKKTTQVHIVEGATHEEMAEFEGPIIGTICPQEQQATFAQLTADFLSQHLCKPSQERFAC